MHRTAGDDAVVVGVARRAAHAGGPLQHLRQESGVFKGFALRVAQIFEQFPAVELVPGHLIFRRDQPPQGFFPVHHFICDARLSRADDPAFFIHTLPAAKGNVRTHCPCRRIHLFQIVRLHRIVRIHKCDPFSACHIKPRVAGGTAAAVGFMEHPHTVVFFCRCITQGRAVVRGTIIHKDQFKVRKGLSQKRVDARRQKALHLVHRHDDADLGLCKGLVCILLVHRAVSFRAVFLWYL